MSQLLGTLNQLRVFTVLRRQRQQAIAQGRHRAQQEVPKNHRKKALIRLPQQMALHFLKQLLAAVCTHAHVALGHMCTGLQISAPPGIANRPQPREQVTPAQAVNQHQQVHRQHQQAIRHRLQHPQQQAQDQHREQNQNGQHPPRFVRQFGAGLQFVQFAQPAAITLQTLAQRRELLDQNRQQ